MAAPSDVDLVAAAADAAIELTGAHPGYDALVDGIADARLVLLGEASHGTHEFSRERAAITMRLIEEKRFTAVAVESDWPDAYRVIRRLSESVRVRRGQTPSDSAVGGPAMHTREIERREWPAFLDGFSRQHEGWLVTVEELPGGEGSSCVETRDLPLQGISVDRDGAISISVGDSPDTHLTRTVDRPTRVIVEQTDTGADQGLRINRDRDEATRVRFRSAVRPEEVDGMG